MARRAAWYFLVQTSKALGLLAGVAYGVWGTSAHAGTQDLLERYAPVFVQEIGHKPLYDLITRFDFDGNRSGTDNVENAPKVPLPAVVYGDVVAETNECYYLFYGVYHVRDYDRRIREIFFPSAHHDNDFEGLMILVDKPSGQVLAMETWWHSKFLQYTLTPNMGRTQTIDGALHLEDGTHPMVFVQAKGHGVRGLQKLDEAMLQEISHSIYRLGRSALNQTVPPSRFVTYTLIPMTDFVRHAQGPFSETSMFAGPQDFGIGENKIGKYLSGTFSGNSSWARPKPPWSWADKFDTLRPGAWFFHPAFVFNRHFRFSREERYLTSLARDRILNVDQQSLDTWVAQKAPSYFDDIPKGPFYKTIKKTRRYLFNLAEYLFYVLG